MNIENDTVLSMSLVQQFLASNSDLYSRDDKSNMIKSLSVRVGQAIVRSFARNWNPSEIIYRTYFPVLGVILMDYDIVGIYVQKTDKTNMRPVRPHDHWLYDISVNKVPFIQPALDVYIVRANQIIVNAIHDASQTSQVEHHMSWYIHRSPLGVLAHLVELFYTTELINHRIIKMVVNDQPIEYDRLDRYNSVESDVIDNKTANFMRELQTAEVRSHILTISLRQFILDNNFNYKFSSAYDRGNGEWYNHETYENLFKQHLIKTIITFYKGVYQTIQESDFRIRPNTQT